MSTDTNSWSASQVTNLVYLDQSNWTSVWWYGSLTIVTVFKILRVCCYYNKSFSKKNWEKIFKKHLGNGQKCQVTSQWKKKIFESQVKSKSNKISTSMLTSQMQVIASVGESNCKSAIFGDSWRLESSQMIWVRQLCHLLLLLLLLLLTQLLLLLLAIFIIIIVNIICYLLVPLLPLLLSQQ